MSRVLLLLLGLPLLGPQPPANARADTIAVTILGAGTPFPDTARFGSAILVEAGGKRLLFDCGRGAVLRLAAIGRNASQIDGLFLTHLHADHVVGIPDLLLTGWFLGRDRPLPIWGPQGTRGMTDHLLAAYAFDIQSREAPPERLPPSGIALDVHEIDQGTVYSDGSLRVTAFTVDHGPVHPAFGYRVDYAGHSVVISGDTKFSPNLIQFAKGADCLIHAAWSVGATNPTPPAERTLASAEDAARVFAAVHPKLAVVTHYRDATGIEPTVRAQYDGQFVLATDLLAIDISRTVTWRAAR